MRKKWNLGVWFLVLFISFASVSSADIYSGGREPNNSSFPVWYSPSVSTFGYDSIYRDAVDAWKGITTRVYLHEYSEPVIGTAYANRLFVGLSSDPQQLGLHVPYGRVLGQIINVTNGSTWLYSVLSVYESAFQSTPTRPDMGRTYRLATAIHEVGHSLKLDHPSGSQNSVMKTNYKNYGVQQYDRTELIRKWGSGI